jgi:SAM-dependent methyltransferase
MNFEDHFSQLTETYFKYRPIYPPRLFEYLAGCCKQHNLAWDCGTGNGQAAVALTTYFDKVFATDASSEQIQHAVPHPKITYRVEPAEKVSLESSGTDLVTVAVAVHWFDFEKFYAEVKRVLKPGGIIAVWTYHLPAASPDIDVITKNFYKEILKDYWPERFKYVDNRYQTLPFPFEEINPPEFEMLTEWDLDQLAGFLSSWSGTKNYLQETGHHPLYKIWDDLKKAWGDEKLKQSVKWPLHVRIGKMS